jgi:peptidoglycan/LPS O-acetylase OafA/YrhL
MLISQKTKIEGLSSVKGFSSLRVLFYHLSLSFFRGSTGFDNKTGLMVFSENYPFWLYLLGEFRVGVNVFFFVSGYLIHALYAKKIFDIRYASFFVKKRLLRLLPPYYVSILVSVAGLLILGGSIGFKDILWHILCIHNFFNETSFTIQAVYWFVAVEIQICIIYTLYRFFIQQFFSAFSVKHFFIASLIVSVGLKLFFYFSENDLTQLKLESIDNTLMRLPDWIIGAVAYEYRYKIANLRFKGLISALLIGTSLCLSQYFVFNYFLSDLCHALAFCLIIPVIIQKKLNFPILNFINKMSFTFYLYHFMIYSIWDVFWTKSLHLERLPGNERLFIILTGIPVTLLSSYLLYQFIEIPIKAYFARYTQQEGNR